jgi:2,4-dienoyl-CoA reductase-like NADH-dependent reductase (Old Yellow Enzyme family)/alpha-beta hydrolase superfamily lysophospholipase
MSGDHATIPDRYVKLHENLARGGVGLIVTGNYFVHRLGVVQDNNLLVESDAVIPELARLTAAVRRQGVPIFAQLNHGGRYARPSLTGSHPLAPSPVKDPISRLVPRAMTDAQIETAIEAFVSAARRMRDAGFDGVELNAAHGYLLNQFLSGFANRRTDRWGGDAESRFRFLAEVVGRARSLLGPGFALTVKLNGTDFMPHGNMVQECVFFARSLESLGVCGVTVSGGFKENPFRTMSRGDIPTQHVLASRHGIEKVAGRVLLAAMRRGAGFSEGYFLPHAAAVKQQVTIPVTAVGGFRSLAFMEQALDEGKADLIGLSRPLVREPSLPRRMREGRTTVASCRNCNRCTVMTGLLSEALRCHWRKELEPEEEQEGDGIRSGHLRVSDGFTLFYRTAVPEKTKGAVLFLHGMSEHSGMYLHVMRALAGCGLAVVAPDQRGRGRSVDRRWRRGDLHSVERVLLDLDELLEHTAAVRNGGPLFVVGISMGSIIAQKYALRRQSSLRGVILVGPPFGVPRSISRPLLAVSSLLAAAAPRLAVRPAPPIPHISRVRAFQNELDWDPWCYHGPVRARAGRELVRTLVELERDSGEQRLPLLLVYGSEDRIVPRREVDELHRHWGGTDRTMEVMEGLYHDVLNEPERDEVIRSITGWLSARL